MSKKVFSIIPEKFVSKIKSCSLPEIYHKPFEAVYHGQTPDFSFYLFSGSVKVYNKDKSFIINQPGLFNLQNLIENKSSPYTIEIQKGSVVSSLDKEQIQSLNFQNLFKIKSIK